MALSADLIRGHLDAILLRLLMEKDRYGYEIAKEIALRTQGRLDVKEATLYAAIQRLERNRYIVSYTGQVTHGRARMCCKPAPGGRAYRREKQAEWFKRYRQIIDRLLKDKKAEIK